MGAVTAFQPRRSGTGHVAMDFIEAFKRSVPLPIRRRMTAPYWWWHNRGQHQLAMAFDRRWAASQASIGAFRDRHAGDRCFIIGNGPSLQNTDLSRLRHENTFGLNRIYLMFPKLGFETSYFVAINTLVVEQCAADIQAMEIPRFITWRGQRWLKEDDDSGHRDVDERKPP